VPRDATSTSSGEASPDVRNDCGIDRLRPVGRSQVVEERAHRSFSVTTNVSGSGAAVSATCANCSREPDRTEIDPSLKLAIHDAASIVRRSGIHTGRSLNVYFRPSSTPSSFRRAHFDLGRVALYCTQTLVRGGHDLVAFDLVEDVGSGTCMSALNAMCNVVDALLQLRSSRMRDGGRATPSPRKRGHDHCHTAGSDHEPLLLEVVQWRTDPPLIRNIWRSRRSAFTREPCHERAGVLRLAKNAEWMLSRYDARTHRRGAR